MDLMKRFFKLALAGVMALQISACTQLRPQIPVNEHLSCDALKPEKASLNTWQSVGPNIWLMQGQPDALSTPSNQGHISNSVFVFDPSNHPHQGWLIGSGPDAQTGQALACSVKQSLGFEVTDLVSTRAYPESVLGAAGLPGVRHWALPQVQTAMKERCTHCLNRLEIAVHAPAPLVPRLSLPDHLIQEPKLGPFDVQSVEVQPEQSVAMLYHRTSNTWILPGVVWGHGLAPQLRDADTEYLLNILERLALQPAANIIPEQGPTGDSGLILKNISYWHRLVERVNERWQKGENQPFDASGFTSFEALNSNAETRLRDLLNAQRVWQAIENKSFNNPK